MVMLNNRVCQFWTREVRPSCPKLDFIHLRGIAERFSEAFQQYSLDVNHVGLSWGR